MHIKLDYKRTALVGLAFLTVNAVWQLYNTEVPLILEEMIRALLETSGNSGIIAAFPVNTVINFIMSLDNIMAIFLLPIKLQSFIKTEK